MITKALFGHTGHLSTRTIFGAAALSKVTPEEADRTLDVLLQYGVNHIDTATSYGDSELHVAVGWIAIARHFFWQPRPNQERVKMMAKGVRISSRLPGLDSTQAKNAGIDSQLSFEGSRIYR